MIEAALENGWRIADEEELELVSQRIGDGFVVMGRIPQTAEDITTFRQREARKVLADLRRPASQYLLSWALIHDATNEYASVVRKKQGGRLKCSLGITNIGYVQAAGQALERIENPPKRVEHGVANLFLSRGSDGTSPRLSVLHPQFIQDAPTQPLSAVAGVLITQKGLEVEE